MTLHETMWHSINVINTEKILMTNINTGLSEKEAQKRIETYGFNEIKETKQVSIYEIFFRQFKSLVVLALIVAMIFSFVMGDYFDGIIIGIILLINAIIGTYQEHKAEKAIEALKKLSATKARVIRSGKQEIINSKELVPGDLILLETGDRVPADAKIIHESNLESDESMLTGESIPSKKNTGLFPEKTLPAYRKNIVFKDTVITTGKAKCIVILTGAKTETGKITCLLSEAKEEITPLQIKLNNLMKLIGGGVIIGIIIILFFGTFITSYTLPELIKLSIAQAVSFIPEGLPIVVTIILAMGVTTMATKRAIVRKLPAVETLGSVSVICTDKTGTLTKNEMTVKQIYTNGELLEVSGDGYSTRGDFIRAGVKVNLKTEKELIQLLKTSVLCNDSSLEKEDTIKIIGDPTEGSLLVVGEKAKIIKQEIEEEEPRVGEIQFDSEKKIMTTFNKKNGVINAHIKGAPENVIELCDYILVNGKKIKFEKELQKNVLEESKKMASNSLRVLGFAFKENQEVSGKKINGLVFLGLVGMIDPVRPEAKKAVTECIESGIRIIMITGDHKLTAEGIAKKLGLMKKNSKVLSGEEVDQMNEKELEKAINNTNVFARTSSIHKTRIVEALKKQGHIVAMTGDGINDALAIKKADIGIAMGRSGTEVTKEASDLVLQDDNFETIVEAIKEGRSAYTNIKKVLIFLLGTNSAEIIILFAILFSGLFLPEALPILLLPIQLLWINLVTDGTCVIPLGMEKKTKDLMKMKPRSPNEKIITKEMIIFIALTAIISAIGTLAVFYIDYTYLTRNIAHARTLAYVTLVFFQLFSAYNARTKKPIIYAGILSNTKLLLAVTISIVLVILTVYLPFLNNALSTVPLVAEDWVIIISTSSLLFLFFEAKKTIKCTLQSIKENPPFDELKNNSKARQKAF